MESMPHPGDAVKQNLLTLADVARQLPPGPTGRKPSACAIWRWATKGLDGIRLPALRLGSTWYVRPSDLEAFGEQLARRSLEKLDKPAAPAQAKPKARSEARRARDIEQAREVLRREGVIR